MDGALVIAGSNLFCGTLRIGPGVRPVQIPSLVGIRRTARSLPD